MKKTDDGRRKERVEKEVQQVISTYLINHLQTELGGLVTVTRVMMPNDLRAAKVYVSYFSIDNSELNIKKLQHWAKDIQDEMSHKLQMRYCPVLTFLKDESTERILKIEKTLSEISPNNSSVSPAGMTKKTDDGDE